ncbi:MAG TPA: hypothetical protein PKY77_18080 [Phycisphaerae bacterium]|nr:hypothetical protein [Phycisphaerae bacterium]HRY70238.1 hypothetical protein [Phycisphaerae bacterium]
MYRILACGIIVSVSVSALAQNLLVNPGFEDPPIAVWASIAITGGVADGDTVEIDTTGANRTYEFDTGDGILPGNVQVAVAAGAGKAAAKAALTSAINADVAAPCTASDGGTDTIRLIWIGVGGNGATNTNLQDANGVISVTDFGSNCHRDTQPITGWYTLTGDLYNDRNDDLYIPTCPGGDNVAHLSMQGWGASGNTVYQTVAGVTPGQWYTFSAVFWAGHMDVGGLTIKLQLIDGASPTGSVLAEKSYVQTNGATNAWLPLFVNGLAVSSGVTVKVSALNGGTQGWALHLDDCSLAQTTCIDPPTIDAIAPAYAARGTAAAAVTITGTGFATGAGNTTVYLRMADQPDIKATTVVVAPDGKSLTCKFKLTTAAIGRWHVVATIAGATCPTTVLPSGFNVILPAFSNGSFESPTATGACPVPVGGVPGFPSDWLAHEQASYGYGSVLFRDSDRFAPTCNPLPEGSHYASTVSDNNGLAGAEASIYQTFIATAGASYTLSGYFAGGGNNTVKIALLDGDENAAVLGSETTIHSPGSQYDWTFASTTGTPTSGLMTVKWTVALDGNEPHAAHADNLQVSVCQNPIALTGITPDRGINNGIADITNLAGTGFSGSPQVVFKHALSGAMVNATAEAVVSDSQITCNVDLRDQTSGYYDVIVVQEGCVGTLAGKFLLLADGLINGEFELPEATLQCGPPSALAGPPSGWNFSDDKWRDHNLWAPTCPRNVPLPDPADEHGHYQSMTTGVDRNMRDQQAWQTLLVRPGGRYRFAGYFAGGGENAVLIRLLDGGIGGTEIAATPVYACTTGCGGYDWTYAEVSGVALSDVMTVVWELTGATTDGSAAHADGLTFQSPCNLPFADANGDSSVDMVDFGLFQLCIGAGFGGEALPEACLCFERSGDGRVTDTDVSEFVKCYSGPAIPWSMAATPDCRP